MNKINYQPLSTALDFVVIIDCLSDEERKKIGITTQLEKDLKELEIGAVTALFKDKTTLLKFLDELSTKAKSGFKFWITIISHGNEECIGFKESGEPVLWSELSTYFQNINQALKNTLVLNMMSCFGLHGIKMTEKKNNLFPCYGLLGSANKLSSKNAKLINRKIFEKILQGKPINMLVLEIQDEIKLETGKENAIYCITSTGYNFIENNKPSDFKKRR